MFEGRKINLRLMTKEDVETLFKLENVYKEKSEYLPPMPRPLAVRMKHFEEKKGWWDDDEGFLAIESKDGRMVGMIAFFTSDRHLAGYEIGYSIFKREDRGQGYGSEALAIFTSYLFELKPIPRLTVMTHPDNASARRIAEKCGFKLEGTLRRAAFIRGDYADLVVYSLVREECRPLSEVLL